MSNRLSIDQRSVDGLFSEKKVRFLIPDYQRPYAWEEDECRTLWEDIFSFAIPDGKIENFNDEEYFLGPIVTFKNEAGQLEIIDGQQRLTTLMLLLRAFYSAFENMQEDNAKKTKEKIEKCIWQTDPFGNPDKNALKIDSEVATDNDKNEFLTILKTGLVNNSQKSNYAKNYKYFQLMIEDFLHRYPMSFLFLPIRILDSCILLPIEADTQDTALTIFSTLNDRGKPLSDADIFKAQFYKYYGKKGEKNKFIKRWKELEDVCNQIFQTNSGSPMDEIFTRYMYFVRAKQGNKKSTTEALRKFFEKDGYKLLQNDETLGELEVLANFWHDISAQDSQRFSEKVLKRLFVLNYAPNGMWNYIVSVYFLQNRDINGDLDNEQFYTFLSKITAFIWGYALMNPGVNALRTPVYAEMIRIVNGNDIDFSDYKFDTTKFESVFNNYNFFNQRPITKSMITWWAFQNKEQELMSLDTTLEIEHIYARNRQEKEGTLSSERNVELLGNKALLEKRINIRASDYRFADKIKYYQGFSTPKGNKEATKIKELISLSKTNNDFVEQDIINRNSDILSGFIEYLDENELVLR